MVDYSSHMSQITAFVRLMPFSTRCDRCVTWIVEFLEDRFWGMECRPHKSSRQGTDQTSTWIHVNYCIMKEYICYFHFDYNILYLSDGNCTFKITVRKDFNFYFALILMYLEDISCFEAV